MPLLDILGVGGLAQSFTIGIAFLSAGSEEDSNWSTTCYRLRGKVEASSSASKMVLCF
jgi:hypothetical protein